MDKKIFLSALFGALVGACGGGGGGQVLASIVAELIEARSGLIVSGTVSGSTVASPAAAIEAQGAPDAGISVYRTGPCDTTSEDFLAFWGKDSTGSPRKNMSISSSWKDCNPASAFTWVRFNAPYVDAAGRQRDYLPLQLHGGRGMSFCGAGGAPDGRDVIDDRCIGLHSQTHFFDKALYIKDQIPEPPTDAGYAALYVDAFGALKIKFGNGTIKTLHFE